ncbi:hypothetical protein ACFQMM_03615 [Saliphagus sp. GCM10025308]
MAVSDHIPLAEAGNTKRNILVGLLYFILLPLVVIVLPFYLLFAIGTNRNGLDDSIQNSSLGSIPGIGAGGWTSAVIVFLIVFVAIGAIGAIGPDTDTGDGVEPEVNGDSNDPGSENTDDQDSSSSNDGSDEGDESESDDGSNGDPEDSDGDGAEDDGESDSADGGDSSDGGDNDDSSDDGSSSGDGDSGSEEPQLTTLESISETGDYHDSNAQTLSGSGQTVTDTITLGGAFTAFDYEHDGGSNFQVEIINEETGETEEYLVNEIGAVDGVTGVGLPDGSYRLDVNADGDWEITVAQPFPEDSEIHSLPAEASGEGNDVVGPIELEGNTVVSGKHSGESNFIVEVVDEDATSFLDGEIIFNEIGEFEGETHVSYEGVVWVVVEADGNWELEFD